MQLVRKLSLCRELSNLSPEVFLLHVGGPVAVDSRRLRRLDVERRELGDLGSCALAVEVNL